MVDYPVRGTSPWDARLKEYIDETATEKATAVLADESGTLGGPVVGGVTEDLFMDWWLEPRFTVIGGYVYKAWVSGMSRAGEQVIGVHDLRSGVGQRKVINQNEQDDHNGAAQIFRVDRPPLMAFARHNLDGILNCRKGAGVNGASGALSLDSLLPATPIVGALPNSETSSYALLDDNPVGSQVVAMTRAGDLYYRMARSTNYANTWPGSGTWTANSRISFVGTATDPKGYVTKAKTDADLCAFAAYNHPTTDGNKVFVFDLRRSTGEFLRLSTGEVVAIAGSSELTLASEADFITIPTGKKARLCSVDSQHNVVLLVWTPGVETDAAYWLAPYTGAGTWAPLVKIVDAGARFGFTTGAHYHAGADTPHSMEVTAGTIVVGVGREKDGVWYLEEYRTTNAGGSFSVTEIRQSALPLVRPTYPDRRLGMTGRMLAATEVRRYGTGLGDANAYLDYYGNTHIIPIS